MDLQLTVNYEHKMTNEDPAAFMIFTFLTFALPHGKFTGNQRASNIMQMTCTPCSTGWEGKVLWIDSKTTIYICR